MKKSLFSAFLLTAACAVAFVACKKDDNKSKSRSELLVGTWNVNAVGTDSNNNGLLEPSEYDAIPAGAAIVQTYRADGSGVFTVKQPGKADTSYNIAWTLTNSDQNLAITFPDKTVSNATISELTDNRLQGYNPVQSPHFIFLLIK